jgi:hypothetical protein
MDIPTKFNDPAVKTQMVAVKYRAEQELTAMKAIEACPEQSYAVELYAGTGGLTSIYQQYFPNILTNDLNKDAETDYHMKAMDLIKEVIKDIPRKIDLIDFDCYGCPALEIQEYFKVRGGKDAPFVLRFSDGLGLWMKRNKKQGVIQKRYLIDGDIDMTKIWLEHPLLIDDFMHRIAELYGMRAEKIVSVVTKFKNYTLGAYKFIKI